LKRSRLKPKWDVRITGNSLRITGMMLADSDPGCTVTETTRVGTRISLLRDIIDI
jgi:hypothetical protein